MASPSFGELDNPPLRYSFYARSETDGMHYVVNYHSSGWWLQLDVVFADKCRWFRFTTYEEKPAFGKDRQGILKPRKVAAAVLQGVKEACSELRIRADPRHICFSQANFECYYLYERAARHLVRHLAENGKLGSLQIMYGSGDQELNPT